MCVSSGIHADPLHPMDVLLCFNQANGQAKVISGRCGVAGTPNVQNVAWHYHAETFHR